MSTFLKSRSFLAAFLTMCCLVLSCHSPVCAADNVTFGKILDKHYRSTFSEVADYVDQTVQKLVASVGQAGDARLLVMASLIIADDLSEALQKLDEQEPGAAAQDNGAEQDAAGALENYAERLEKIAARLEAT